MLEQIVRKKLYKFMDFIGDLAHDHGSYDFIEDLNHIFREHNFGYRMVLSDRGFGERYRWDIRKELE